MKTRLVDLRGWLPVVLVGITLVLIYAFAVWMGWIPLNPFEALFGTKEQLRDQLQSYGPLAPIIYIALYALQIVVAPIPGAALAYAAGFVFGTIPAVIYSITGILIGSAGGFLLARRFGMPVIEKMAPKSWIDRWSNLSQVNSSFTWFLLMLAPTADVFYFIAGLTKLSFRRFMVIVFLGRLPGIILSSWLGDNFDKYGAQWIFILIGAMLLVALGGNWLRQRIEKRALVDAKMAEAQDA